MVYAGERKGRRLTLGVSGRLKDGNLIMWDQETGTLWSQIQGRGLQGDLEGAALDMLPAVFVGLGTWERMHPDTVVLDLPRVRARSWFYTTEDLARGEVDGRTLAVGLRQGGDTVAVPLPRLHDAGVVELEVGGEPLAVVWHRDERAVLVYERELDGETLPLSLEDHVLVDDRGRRWSALTGAARSEDTPDLRRAPYVPTALDAWREYYPDGRVLELG